MTTAPEPDAHVRGTQVVDRVFDILDAFVEIGPELAVKDVSRSVGLSYSTAHRLLDAMARRGILYRDHGSRRYRIGSHLRHVALASIGQMGLADHARPFLVGLAASIRVSSHLGVLDGGMVLYVDRVDSMVMPRHRSHVGQRLPAYCTGVGKAILAFSPEQDVDAVILGGLVRHTPTTITDADAFRAELGSIRARGWALDAEEIEEGIVCVAAPIRDRSGTVVAAVSVGGPASRMRSAPADALAAEVLDAAAQISAMLGWVPERHVGDRSIASTALG